MSVLFKPVLFLTLFIQFSGIKADTLALSGNNQNVISLPQIMQKQWMAPEKEGTLLELYSLIHNQSRVIPDLKLFLAPMNPDRAQVYPEPPFTVTGYGGGDQTKGGGKSSDKKSDSKKEQKKDQESKQSKGSSTQATSGSSGDSSRNKKPIPIPQLIEKLEALARKISETKKTDDQSGNIAKFQQLLRQWVEGTPKAEKFLVVMPEGLFTPPPLLTRLSVLLILRSRFLQQYTNGELVFITIINPDLLQPGDPMAQFSAELSPEVSGRDSYPPRVLSLMQETLLSDYELMPLLRYFMDELPNIPLDDRRIYTIQALDLHSIALYIRRKADNSYRVFIADSIQAFRSEHSEMDFSQIAELAAMALFTALDALAVTDARFFYLPGRRQVDPYTCIAFMVNDLNTLLEQPILPGNGYYVASTQQPAILTSRPSVPATKGFLMVNGKPWEQAPPTHLAGLVSALEQTLEKHFKMLSQQTEFNSSSFGIRKLVKFPGRFLRLTQGKNNLKTLTREFSAAEKAAVEKRISPNRGRLTMNGTQKSDANLSAQILYMELVIELLKEIEGKSLLED